ncbi:MAG: hypothetical protein ACRDZ8_07790 [Acidimicrobiales bacterium]
MRALGTFTGLSAVVAMTVSAVGLSITAAAGSVPITVAAAPGCQLGNGVQHVVEITFDNVHYNRDNPNVPSDLELIPSLLNFIEGNGTMLPNNHTPLIAHTADDSLTNYSGLYGDRQGMGVSNGYQTYNPDGTTDPAGSFAYWTDPVFDEASTPAAGHDTNPSMVYSATPPATTKPTPADTTTTPAPWVPFTRSGCNVGDVSTANTVLENTAVDFPEVFGSNSPENTQLQADTDSFKDAETADYVGLAVHCAQGATFCSSASGVKFAQPTATPTAVTDSLPDEPGGYSGFQALFGHRYLAPQLGAGTDSVTRDGYAVTNSAGNLVDLSGKQLNGAFLTNHPGFPGFSTISASQSLAYVADMEESGVPVTEAYISDIHGNNSRSTIPQCAHAPAALGSGDPCYLAQAQAYNTAFATFFARLAADGINSSNTEFVFTADEGDHEAGANVGRAIQPTPANCDGVTIACTYPPGSFGELSTNVTGLLATEKSDTTPFTLEADTAPEFYVKGQPAPGAPQVRQLERDVATLTASNPYSGNPSEDITNYVADPTEEAILHFVDADPARTPTFAMFAKPDYFVQTGVPNCNTACVSVNNGFAWDHGDYAAEINNTWLGLVGPGVINKGVDGFQPNQGPSSAGPTSGQITSVESATTGTWVDHTDIRATLLYLCGLRDDYIGDGRVITQDLTGVPSTLGNSTVTALGNAYKQLNSSVGLFGAYTLVASTTAVESNTPGDTLFKSVDNQLKSLEKRRDALATKIKAELFNDEFHGQAINAGVAIGQTAEANALITVAKQLAAIHA